MNRRYYRGRNVARAFDIEELRQMARRRLPGFVLEYLEGGSEDEQTLRGNRDAFGDYRFVRRVAVDVDSRSTASTLFGRKVGMPVAIAPTGFNGLLWRSGDLALARAAKEHDIPFALSIVASQSIEEVAKEVGGRLWMMLLPLKDQSIVDRVLERAAAVDCEALIVTLDASIIGNRTWDFRNFARPLVLSLRAKLDVLMHQRWFWGVFLPRGLPGFGNLAEFLPPGKHSPLDGSRFITTQSNNALTWPTIRSLRERWKGKLILKGVMTVADAEQAARLGVDGIVVSNHGGRQLDGELAPMQVLEEIAAAVGSRLEILIDSGFRRGTEIVKAIALGARGVLLGRAALYGLAAGGETGARRALEILKTEVHRTIGLLGCPAIDQLSPAFVRRVVPLLAADRDVGADRELQLAVANKRAQ